MQVFVLYVIIFCRLSKERKCDDLMGIKILSSDMMKIKAMIKTMMKEDLTFLCFEFLWLTIYPIKGVKDLDSFLCLGLADEIVLCLSLIRVQSTFYLTLCVAFFAINLENRKLASKNLEKKICMSSHA